MKIMFKTIDGSIYQSLAFAKSIDEFGELVARYKYISGYNAEKYSQIESVNTLHIVSFWSK